MPEKKTKTMTHSSSSAKQSSTKTSAKNDSKKESINTEEVVKNLEKTAEEVEAKTDKTVEELTNKIEFVDKIEKASWVKEILNLSFINNANVRVRKHLNTICKVLGRLYFIIGIFVLILALIGLFGGFIELFKGSVGTLLLSLLSLAGSILIIILGRGFIKMKKWLPAILMCSILLDIALLIIYIIGGKEFGRYLLQIILYVLFTLFVLKNKDLFNK